MEVLVSRINYVWAVVGAVMLAGTLLLSDYIPVFY